MTVCDANSGFYGKGKMSLYVKVAKSTVARRQLSQCGDDLAMEEDVVEELFHSDVVYFDKLRLELWSGRVWRRNPLYVFLQMSIVSENTISAPTIWPT